MGTELWLSCGAVAFTELKKKHQWVVRYVTDRAMFKAMYGLDARFVQMHLQDLN